jgi:hypothetical protein
MFITVCFDDLNLMDVGTEIGSQDAAALLREFGVIFTRDVGGIIEVAHNLTDGNPILGDWLNFNGLFAIIATAINLIYLDGF